jgi:DNA-binding CsgD family transcriptional regulator
MRDEPDRLSFAGPSTMNPFRQAEAKAFLSQAVLWTRRQPPGLLSAAEVWNLTLLSHCNLARYQDLAEIRGISENTIRRQMRSARLKLDARTNLFAVAEALRRDLIPRFSRWKPGERQAEIILFPAA